jgi:hypothetical protein
MRLRLILGCVLLVVLAACGGNDEPSQQPQAKPAETRAAPTTATTVPSRCEKVSSAVLKAIAEGLTVSGGGGSLRNGHAVKSKDFSKVYMVAADIQGDGMEGNGEVGVWTTNSLEGTGLIFAVDSFAKEFSDWGHGDTTDANITDSSDGIAEAKECATR